VRSQALKAGFKLEERDGVSSSEDAHAGRKGERNIVLGDVVI